MIEPVALSALALSALVYVALGLKHLRRNRTLRDQLPIGTTGEARVAGSAEFSAATVAATISLATVILAFAELAPVFGVWLGWSAVTTAAGLVVVRFAAPSIWRRLAAFGAARPTLHGFLGTAFASQRLACIAAICTSLGFLGALAVELTVGARFLAGLIPSVPPMAAVIVLALVGIGYSLAGGFRTVILTDRIQMFAIWISIAALAGLVALRVSTQGGISHVIATAPSGIFDFSWREGLLPFLLGILIINVPTFLSDMSVWQRIAATRSEDQFEQGIARSAVGAFLSWTLLVILACLVATLAPASGTANSISMFLGGFGAHLSLVTGAAIFSVIVGFYAAGLSTASTLLIAASHTLHQDLLRGGRSDDEFADSAAELRLSRLLVLVLGVASVVLVETLSAMGFSIADLVFAIYGAQLGMVPAVLLALFGDQVANRGRGQWIACAILAGFGAGWASAGYGKWIGDGNLVFLAPVVSLAVSSSVCAVSLVTGAGSK